MLGTNLHLLTNWEAGRAMVTPQRLRDQGTEEIAHSLLFNPGSVSRTPGSLAHSVIHSPWRFTTSWLPNSAPCQHDPIY